MQSKYTVLKNILDGGFVEHLATLIKGAFLDCILCGWMQSEMSFFSF